VEMLDQNKGHAGISGQMLQQIGEGFQAPGRGSDADDRKPWILWRRSGVGWLRFRRWECGRPLPRRGSLFRARRGLFFGRILGFGLSLNLGFGHGLSSWALAA